MAGVLRLALAAAAALMLAPAGAPAATVPEDFPGVYPSKHDTLDAERRTDSMDLQARVGVGTLRMPFDWSAFERAPGVWDFSTYDPVVADAAARGLRILPILFDPPSFRSTRGSSTKRGMYPPSEPAAMGEFAAQLVRRYGPAGSLWTDRPDLPRVPIRAWQVWNEPNIPPFWPDGADPAAYTRLLEAVAAAIRAVDPKAEIVAAGLPNSAQGPSVKTYLTAMYDAGAAGAFDTLAIHPYGSDFYEVMGQIHEMRAIATKHGDAAAPIWVTELGWPTDGQRGDEFVTEDEQARLVTQTFRGFAANRVAMGLRGFVYFYWRESAPDPRDTTKSIWGNVGLIAPDRPKPAFYAFADIVAEMLARPPVTPDDPEGPGPTNPPREREDDPAPPCGDACADPTLTRLTVSPAAFRAAPRGAALARNAQCSRPGGRTKRGACVALRLDRARALVAEVERRSGRRWVRVGKAVRAKGVTGLNRLWLSGRTSAGRLRPGLYRLVAAPLDAAGGRARSASRKFRVLAEPGRSRR